MLKYLGKLRPQDITVMLCVICMQSEDTAANPEFYGNLLWQPQDLGKVWHKACGAWALPRYRHVLPLPAEPGSGNRHRQTGCSAGSEHWPARLRLGQCCCNRSPCGCRDPCLLIANPVSDHMKLWNHMWNHEFVAVLEVFFFPFTKYPRKHICTSAFLMQSPS